MGMSSPHSPAPKERSDHVSATRSRRSAFQHVLVYGIIGAVLTAVLQVVEYRWLIIGHSFEIYAALVAVLFAGMGIWAGRALAKPIAAQPTSAVAPVSASPAPPPVAATGRPGADAPFQRDQSQVAALGLTPRELDILEAIAAGLSNREIAAQLFVSENTVKTHSGRVFEKLGVQRRVQAVQQARRLGLIP